MMSLIRLVRAGKYIFLQSYLTFRMNFLYSVLDVPHTDNTVIHICSPFLRADIKVSFTDIYLDSVLKETDILVLL